MKRLTLPLLAIVVFSTLAALAQDSPGVPKVGFVFSTGSGVLRETPDAGAKQVGRVPGNSRLVYRRVVEGPNGPAWYRVEPPGGTVGWLSAAEASTKRSESLPPPKPIATVVSGVGAARSGSAQTAAARGLSRNAAEYASKNPDFKKGADHFVTLEAYVEKLYDDPHDAEGNYPDVTVPKRIERANAWKAGVK